MGKIAFVFPGQGAQKVGMGKEFYDSFPVAKEIFDKASEAVGLDLRALCFEENKDIDITEFTQVALLTTSVATMEVLRERGYGRMWRRASAWASTARSWRPMP